MTENKIISLIRQYSSKASASYVSLISSLGFTPENVVNKTTVLDGDSDTLYPTQKTVKDALDNKIDERIGASEFSVTGFTELKTLNFDDAEEDDIRNLLMTLINELITRNVI